VAFDRCLERLSPLWVGAATRGFAGLTGDLYEDAIAGREGIGSVTE
jgi:hypothetical protein